MQVGLIIVLASIILFFSYGWLINLFEGKKFKTIRVSFNHSNGIGKGSPVSILGIDRGRVENVEIKTTGVVLQLRVELEHPLLVGTKFSIIEVDMMGNKKVDIDPSKSGELLDLNKIHKGEVVANITTLVVNMNDFITKLNYTLENINDEINKFDDFWKVLSNTNLLLDRSILLVDKINKRTDILVSAEELINNSNESILEISDFFHEMNRKDGIVFSTQKLLKNSNTLIENLVDGKGSFGKLIDDMTLYDRLVSTINDLDTLLIDIKKEPKRYFKFSLF